MLEKLQHHAPLVRRCATAVCALALTGGLLAGCGFYDATERPYTPAHGANDNAPEAEVAALGAVIVSTEPGSGTFITTVSNKSLSDDVALISVVSADPELPLTVSEFEPKRAIQGGYVNLADAGGIEIEGGFGAGDFVRLDLGFDNGDKLTVDMPVVLNSGYWEGLDGPAPPVEEPEETE